MCTITVAFINPDNNDEVSYGELVTPYRMCEGGFNHIGRPGDPMDLVIITTTEEGHFFCRVSPTDIVDFREVHVYDNI